MHHDLTIRGGAALLHWGEAAADAGGRPGRAAGTPAAGTRG